MTQGVDTMTLTKQSLINNDNNNINNNNNNNDDDDDDDDYDDDNNIKWIYEILTFELQNNI